MNWKLFTVLVVALLLTVALFAGGAYAADARFEATIVDKDCAGPAPPDEPDPSNPDPPPTDPASLAGALGPGANSTVTIRTKGFGIEHTVTEFDDERCWFLRDGDDGNFVVYHLRTGRALFYEREGGACLYDTDFGPFCMLPEVVEAAEAAAAFAEASVVLSTNGYAPDPTGQAPHSAPNCATFHDDATTVAATAQWYAADSTQETLRLVLWAEDADGQRLAETEVEGATGIAVDLELPNGTVAWTVAVAPPSSDPLQMGTVPSIAIGLEADGARELVVPEPSPCRP